MMPNALNSSPRRPGALALFALLPLVVLALLA